MQNIYTLNLLRIEEKDESMLEKELKIENCKYERQISLEDYKDRICSFNSLALKYKLAYSEENAYFLNFFDADYCVRTNCTDINEAGVYNYACIISYPIGVMYGSCEPCEFYLYRYNRDNDEYVEVSSNEDVHKFVATELGTTFLIKNDYKESAFHLFQKDVIPNLSDFTKKYGFESVANNIMLFIYRFGLIFDSLRMNSNDVKPFSLSLSDNKDGVSLDWETNDFIFHFVFTLKDEDSYVMMYWNENGVSCNKKIKMDEKNYSYVSMKVLLLVKENTL